MEVKHIAKSKTLGKMSSTSETSAITGIETHPLKKFTIPKIRRTAGKVHLSPCQTNTREYSFIHETLNQCRLDINWDLRSSWQLGETQLVHNEDLEKNFSAKRSEMRESGRHGRELEEHFCFLVHGRREVLEISQNGISTKTSTLKILGNPRLGIYVFRHIDVALNYAYSKNNAVERIIIFKVLFGKVKKIQPCVDKNKVSLDPSPNFDCHMSRNTPSVKDSVELQAHGSAVYLYEYNELSKPVDKPRQCLPYAVVTVKFIGQKADNGNFTTPLRFFSTGFPKRTERTCSLNNCTVAKRIGKGKDATVVFEHFGKPLGPFVQESCWCDAPNSERSPSISDAPTCRGSAQPGDISILERRSGHSECNLIESSGSSQALACDSNVVFMPSDTREGGNNSLMLNMTQLENILSGLSPAFPLHSNISSSTVTTSKLIKDPRLMRREENKAKQNNVTGLKETSALEKSLDSGNSEAHLSAVSAGCVSSPSFVPRELTVVTDPLDAPSFQVSSDDLLCQVHNVSHQDYDYATPSAGQFKDQGYVPLPVVWSDVVSGAEDPKHSEEKVQRINTPLFMKPKSEPGNAYEPMNVCTKNYPSHISQESPSSDLKTVYPTDHEMSLVSVPQKRESTDLFIQNIENLRNLKIDPDSKHGEKRNLWEKIDHYFIGEAKAGSVDDYISLHQEQEHKEGAGLDSSRESCDQRLITQELEMPVSSTSTTKDKYELGDLTMELQDHLTADSSQNCPQKVLEYENNDIHTSFVISQEQMAFQKEETNQNYASIMTDTFQEAKDTSEAKELPIDTVISSHGSETLPNNFSCSRTEEHTWVHRENGNVLVSLEDDHKDCQDSPPAEDQSQDCPVFCDPLQKVDFREHKDNDKGRLHEVEEEDVALSTEGDIRDVYQDEQLVLHTNSDFTNRDEMKKNQNCSNVDILVSENFSTIFNLTGGENYVPTETTLREREDTGTSLKQKDTKDNGKSLVFPEVPCSTASTASIAEVRIAVSAMPILSTNVENHQRYQFKETCYSESTHFDLLVKSRISECAVDTDKNEAQDSCHQSSVSENLGIQSLELEGEVEVETEQDDDDFVFQQDTHSHKDVLGEELGSSYEALKCRIDWGAILGSSSWQTKALESSTGREPTDHDTEESHCFYSSAQKTRPELLNSILLPDLQVRITNIFWPGLSQAADSFEPKDDHYKHLPKAEESETNEGEKRPGLGINSQSSGENSGYSCDNKPDNLTEESGQGRKYETSQSLDFSQNTHANHVSEKQNGPSLFTASWDVTTVNHKSSCSFAKSNTDCKDAGSKMHSESGISQKKPHLSFRDQNLSEKDLRHHEMYDRKRRPTRQDSLECFFALSQGRMKTFSQSEKHIRSVLDILNSEASLCKSRRLSRKLDRAVLHLKKAHRRVHTSLKLVAKVGEKRKGPLPKSYAIICNNFWESCDLEGYSSVCERNYYSTRHFFSRRKDSRGDERRAVEWDVGKSFTRVSKPKSYNKVNGEGVTRHLSERNTARSHTTIHMEQHPRAQLCLSSVSQSTSPSAFNTSRMKLSRSSDRPLFSGKTRCLHSPDHPDEKLSEKENQIGVTVVSNTGKRETLESHSTRSNMKGVAEEINSMADEVIRKSNSVSGSVSVNTDENYDATHRVLQEVNTDVLISFVKSSAQHFLNVDTYKANNISSGCKRNLEVSFPVEKCAVPVEGSVPNVFTRNFPVHSLNTSLTTSKKPDSAPQLSSTARATESESSKFCLEQQRILAVDSLAASPPVSHHQQECGEQKLRKTKPHSRHRSQVDGNDAGVTENSVLDLVTERNKSCGENTMKKCFSQDSSQLLTDNAKSSSKKCITVKTMEDRKMGKVKQAGKPRESNEDTDHKKSRTEESPLKTVNKNQKKVLEKASSCLSEKTVKNTLMESPRRTENAPSCKALSVNNIVPNPLTEREKNENVQVNKDSQPDSVASSEITHSFKVGIRGMNHKLVLHALPEAAKVTILQKTPTLYMNELKEQCSASHTAFIAKLSQILQRADKASSLQILQEETKICQNILPSFIEAFERNQECSLEEILISRDLLVQQNLWNNYKSQLKPCAVDSLVELQMVMETIQFVENKKRLLGDEPTFRSLLWYDETLYSELLGEPRGYQQQASFFPAFQGRLKYNAFCELQKYHDQLRELLEEAKRGENSYYAFLKYKRQIKECEAIMKHCSDCFDFALSVPFTCGVNLGDSLGDLEALRKSTLELIRVCGHSPQIHSYPGKQDHLWTLIEMISSKVNFIRSSEAVSIKISLYGLEHIFFDAAKSLVWEEKRQSSNKKYSRKNYKEMLLQINQEAFSKLQEIYDALSKDLSSEQTSSTVLEDDTTTACKMSDALINKATVSIESYKFNSTFHPHPDIFCIGEILEEAEFADLEKLQELTGRCTDHVEILKKYFQMLQEDSIDNIVITEENALDMVKNPSRETIMLKPEAVETYIEIVMTLETIHFLKNSVAKKLDKQRFRGMLWFDSSLVSELVHCQEEMACFSFLKDNSSNCLWKGIESAVSELTKEIDTVSQHSEAVNCSYALHLLSRELEELSAVKTLLGQSKCPISAYIDTVPCVASIHYGGTVTELEYHYGQFSALLRDIVAAPQKDLGKMAHVTKVMETIKQMKTICVKNAELTVSFVLCQILHNREKTFQLTKKGEIAITVMKHGKSKINSSAGLTVPSGPESTIRNISGSSRKRPITVDTHEDPQEQEGDHTLTSSQKQKVNMKDVRQISKEKAACKNPRTTRSHPQSENVIESSSSDDLKRNHVSPEKAEIPRSSPDSLLPVEDLKEPCTANSESKIDVTEGSAEVSHDFAGQQRNPHSQRKTGVSFSAQFKRDKNDGDLFTVCDQKSVDNTFSKDHKTPSRKFKISRDPAQQSYPSDIKPGIDTFLPDNTSVLSKPIFRFVRDVHASLQVDDPVVELHENDLHNSSTKNPTCNTFPEPVSIHNKIPVQINEKEPAKTESKEKHAQAALDLSAACAGVPGSVTLPVTRAAERCLSQQPSAAHLAALPETEAARWTEPRPSAHAPVPSCQHAWGAPSPYYTWRLYHYSSMHGSSVTQTYQGITTYGAQPVSSGMLSAAASTVQNTHANLFYSQYFGYFAEGSQTNGFLPVNGYFHSQTPTSYGFPGSVCHQPLPPAAYLHPPGPSVPPEVLWPYAPWQQESFQPGH